MPLQDPQDVTIFGCLNIVDTDALAHYCEELEQSIQKLSAAIEDRRIQREKKRKNLSIKRD